MFKNYIKVAFRNLNKNRSYAAINILGLALGLMVCILVFLFVTKETSYEKHITGYERIYRTGINASMMGQQMEAPISCSPMAQTLRTEFTEVETASRIKPIRQEILLSRNEKKMYSVPGMKVDSAFFNVFDYKFIHGDPNTAMKVENGIVLTEETAQKFFGEEIAMDKIINYDNRKDYIVTGVIEQSKGDSHFEANYFIAENEFTPVWSSNNYYTYIKLKEGVHISDFAKNMEANFMSKLVPEIEKFMKVTIEDFTSGGNYFQYELQPIQDIHLHSQKDWEIQQNGNIIYIYIFIAIALLVLIIAGINFMNLATARSAKRAKEVGIRKVSGASQGMLITQFLVESVVQSLAALFTAFIMVELFLPQFNNIMETDLSLFDDNFFRTIGFGVIITVVYGVLSGCYPAFFLSSFRPSVVLKGDMTKTKTGTFFRKAMVVTQFAASIILIIGMAIIFSQIRYMHNKDLGFTGEQVLVVPIQTDKVAENFRTYKKEFLKHPNILQVSRSSYLPSDIPNQNMFQVEGSEEHLPLWNMEVDYDFFETMEMTLAEGRDFNRELDADSSINFILNETALKNFNIENPIGKRFYSLRSDGSRPGGQIVGIVKDFHIEGFNQAIKPMVFSLDNDLWWASLKISPENMKGTIAHIESKWNEIEPSHPFRYKLMDAKFASLFQQQENFGKIFLYLTILAIIIAAMGLFGLASFIAEQRTKEIGIRKVLGASVPQLMQMLTKDFVKLVLIANIFAWPISLLLARNWLSRFTYQIEMPVLPFIAAAAVAVIIAVLTVSYQAYLASVSDPVKALKYE